MDGVIDGIVTSLGIEGTTLLAVLAVTSLVCRLIGKSIPDDATGALGIVRKISKLIGLYVSNRLTTNMSTNDAAAKAVGIHRK